MLLTITTTARPATDLGFLLHKHPVRGEAHGLARGAVVCRDEEVARRRFGITGEGAACCYTRTGRRFFSDAALESAFLARVREACGSAALWDRLETDWVCLDAEILPWSVKAQELLRGQYATVGAAATAALGDAHASRRWSGSCAANRCDVHECVFGVLALESEPVDPRL